MEKGRVEQRPIERRRLSGGGWWTVFTEGVAARQLGCALANTRSLSVSALGTVCHLLEAERGNPRIHSSSSAPLATLIIFHLPSPLFINRVFFRSPSLFARPFLPRRLFRFVRRPCAIRTWSRDDGSSAAEDSTRWWDRRGKIGFDRVKTAGFSISSAGWRFGDGDVYEVIKMEGRRGEREEGVNGKDEWFKDANYPRKLKLSNVGGDYSQGNVRFHELRKLYSLDPSWMARAYHTALRDQLDRAFYEAIKIKACLVHS